METSSLVPCPYCGSERSSDGKECSVCQVTHERAKSIEPTFRVKPGLYLIGSLERGLTVYKQQIRAHDLVWSLWELNRRKEIKIERVAVVGGGIAGLTAAACFLSRFEETVSVTLFEQRWDLCPLQQGADNRWLHPKIYNWPAPESRAPSASLPVLNWSEGRASDVARTVINEFSKFSKAFATSEERLTIFLHAQYLRINAGTNKIEWVASKAKPIGPFHPIEGEQGSAAVFDTIVLAVGFGLETQPPEYPTESYWRNEQIGQPTLDRGDQQFLVSGFGDGALIDLCRLTIERYRQDTILYELFADDLYKVEERLHEEWRKRGADANAFEFFNEFEEELLLRAKNELSNRIRKDTSVVLHIRGKNGRVKSISEIFGPHSSFQNRLMLFLLHRCGAFSIELDDLDTAVRKHGVSKDNVICRYGADSLGHLLSVFVDSDQVEGRLKELKGSQEQRPELFWEPGTFPQYPVKRMNEK